MTRMQANRRLSNYLRTHRRNVGLTQRELEQIVGYCDDGAVSRHERFQVTPPLVVALAYEIVFRVPVSQIFAGLRDEVEENVEERLVTLEKDLQQRSAKDLNANTIAKKLVWLCERRSSEDDSR